MDGSYLSTTVSEEWEQWIGRNIDVETDSIGLASEPAIEYTNLKLSAVDITVDREGAVLTLDADGNVTWRDRGEDSTERLWTSGDRERVEDPASLCVAGRHVYVVDGADGSIVIVSRRTEAAIGRIDARLEDPVDIIRRGERIFILDGGSEERAGRVLMIRPDAGVETLVRGLASPTAVTADSSRLYLIEHPGGEPVIRVDDISHLESGSLIPASRRLDGLEDEQTGETIDPVRIETLTDQELIVLGRSGRDEDLGLYHYTFDGTDGTLTHRDDFALSCSKLLSGVGTEGRRYPRYYAIAGGNEHVYVVDERQSHRRNPHDGRYSAQAFRRFDSGSLDTEWDRLTLAFDDFPANTQVVASYRAVNDSAATGRVRDLSGITDQELEALFESDIVSLWALVETGPETVAAIVGDDSTDRTEQWHEEALDRIDGDRWSGTGAANERDILLEDVTGQYLHVKLELVGTADSSPAIGSFRVEFPKETYLRYLPGYFQQNDTRDQFLSQFLSIFESEYDDIEQEIERITEYFDPEAVPSESLAWLSRWLAIEHADEWPVGAKRELLARAPDLFRLRGTKEGMRQLIRLYLNHVEIPDTSWMGEWQRRRIEARRLDGYLTEEEVGEHLRTIDERTSGYPPGHMLCFFEHLDLDTLESDSARRPYTLHMGGPQSFVAFIGPFMTRPHREAVEGIVERERPAHTRARVVELKQELKLEGDTFLGINSTLMPRRFVLGQSTLGGDAVLKERDQLSSSVTG